MLFIFSSGFRSQLVIMITNSFFIKIKSGFFSRRNRFSKRNAAYNVTSQLIQLLIRTEQILIWRIYLKMTSIEYNSFFNCYFHHKSKELSNQCIIHQVQCNSLKPCKTYYLRLSTENDNELSNKRIKSLKQSDFKSFTNSAYL